MGSSCLLFLSLLLRFFLMVVDQLYVPITTTTPFLTGYFLHLHLSEIRTSALQRVDFYGYMPNYWFIRES